MSTATMTDTARAEMKAAANAPFDPPTRRRGQMVTYFTTGQRHGRQMFGFVSRLGERFTDIQLTDGSIITAVAHIDDPKLANQFVRDKGAWDHTEEEVFRRKERHALYRRLRQVEFAVLHSPMATRDMVCDHAKLLGITGYAKAKIGEVKEMIRKRYEELYDTVDPFLAEEGLIADEDETTDVDSLLPPPEDSALLNDEPAKTEDDMTDG